MFDPYPRRKYDITHAPANTTYMAAKKLPRRIISEGDIVKTLTMFDIRTACAGKRPAGGMRQKILRC
jgi:hypothetical protein